MRNPTLLRVMTAMCIMIAMVGCDHSSNIAKSPADTASGPTEVPLDQIGKLHNTFLRLAFEQLQTGPGGSLSTAGKATQAQKRLAAFVTANTLLERYHKPRMTMLEVRAAIEHGREAARRVRSSVDQTPHKMVANVLDGERYNGVLGYTYYLLWAELRQKGLPAAQVLNDVALKYGPIRRGSRLAIFFDVLLHSDEFWTAHYENQAQSMAQLSGANRGWRKFMKFLTLTATDAGAGALAGAGYGAAGGPGGAAGGGAVGAVVGALASWGASDIIN